MEILMKTNFYMPVKVLFEDNCIANHQDIFADFGKKALIVTGRNSAKQNGSEADVIDALTSQNIQYIIFDKIMSNPTVNVVYEGSMIARDNNCDFIISIGGGSPMDAGKAIALLARQDIPMSSIFSGGFDDDALPMIHIPTTAGTGSEVTPYAILTNDIGQTKTSISSPCLFPKVALCDPKYMSQLSITVTINTALDALSHSMEGMISKRSSQMSNILATQGIRTLASCYDVLLDAVKNGSEIDMDTRSKLLYASTLGGMVISHTGTTAVHAMGYGLTYFKNVDHGLANGLLLGEFAKFTAKTDSLNIIHILAAMKLADCNELCDWISSLIAVKPTVTEDEIKTFASIAIKSKSINYCPVKPTESDLIDMYTKSLF